MNRPEQSPLGKLSAYPRRYAPELLFPIPRRPKRAELGLADPLPFHGADVWNAYELSWLDDHGKPQIALAQFQVPADSPHIIESKSFKLYLNSFAQERLVDHGTLQAILHRDLSAVVAAKVAVRLIPPHAAAWPVAELHGQLLDLQPLDIDDYGPPRPEYLQVQATTESVAEVLVSHLLCSHCPVTGQPDWGSVQISYRGAPIEHAGLLRYLVSFRDHREFHEQCVERIWRDIQDRCAPAQLHVDARYTRRGGLDINPYRSSRPDWTPQPIRTVRQ